MSLNEMEVSRSGAGRFAYLLQVFPKYSETFILNELLEHQRSGRRVRVLSLRFPREGRFHELLAELQEAAEYIPEALFDQPRKVFESLAATAAKSLTAFGVLRQWGRRDTTLRDLWQAVMVRRWSERRGVTHLHCHFGGFAARVAYLSRVIGGPTYSVTLHAHDIFRETVDHRLLRDLIRESEFCVTVSQFNALHLTQRIGAHPDKIRVLHNGVPLERFVYSEGSRESGTILSVGRLIEKKGFVHLVRACRILKERGLLRRCEIIGEGREHSTLEAEIRRLGLQDEVKLVGAMSQAGVAEALKRSAVFALPCVTARDGNMDALPTVLLEAMASGCPAVSTRLSGIPEILVDGQSGLLIECGDEVGLAYALSRVLTDADYSARLALGGRKRVEELFDVRKSVATLGDWLEGAATRGMRATADDLATPQAQFAPKVLVGGRTT